MCKHLGWEETLALFFLPFSAFLSDTIRRNYQEERARAMMREKCTKNATAEMPPEGTTDIECR